jgi:hypothetical protein
MAPASTLLLIVWISSNWGRIIFLQGVEVDLFGFCIANLGIGCVRRVSYSYGGSGVDLFGFCIANFGFVWIEAWYRFGICTCR